MRLTFGRLFGFCLSAVLLSACEPPGSVLVPVKASSSYSLANDFLIPASNGLGIHRQALTAGDGPNGQQVLFINYAGAVITKTANDGSPSSDDATLNRSWIPNVGSGSTISIPAFNTSLLTSPRTDQEIKDRITGLVTDWYAPYNVYVVTARPASGRYTMVMVGGQTSQVVTGQADAVGVAALDCGNDNQNNIGFAFAASLPPAGTSAAQKDQAMLLIAQTIAHEAGHTFGLEHVNSPNSNATDIMEPAVDPNVSAFLSGNQPLSEGTSSCGGGTQEDTNARLLNNLGVAPAGTTAVKPTVTWLAPKNGASVPRTFTAAVSASTTSGTITKVEIVQAGAVDATLVTPPYKTTFKVPTSVPDGTPVRFTAIAYNSVGGKASVATDFTISSSATEPPLPCILAVDCDSTQMCQAGTCVDKPATCSPACGAGEVCDDTGTCVPAMNGGDGGMSIVDTEVGKACTDSSECGTSGICASSGGKQYCTQACDPANEASCPADYRCVAVGADHYCGPKPSGCEAAGPTHSSELPLVWFLFAAGLVTARRRVRPSAT